MMVRVFIGLGANVAPCEANIKKALALLDKEEKLQIVRVSGLRVTKPVGGVAQDDFLNGAVEVLTELSAQELLCLLKKIEQIVGRKQRQHWGPREIDLDILYYGDEIIHNDTLTVPHHELAKRTFVLVPLVELAPEFVHPLLRLSNRELLERCKELK